LYDEHLDEQRYFDWYRERGTIGNVVNASYPERAPHNLGLGVAVCLRLPTGRELTLDGTSVNYLNGRLLTYEFPMWRALFIRSPRRLADILIEETDRALSWFDEYATPAQCLERLPSPERNGVRVGTPQWVEATELLEALAAEGSMGGADEKPPSY
jgi:hypothetical protein